MYGIVFFVVAIIYFTISIIVRNDEEKRKFWLAMGLFVLALGLLKGI